MTSLTKRAQMLEGSAENRIYRRAKMALENVYWKLHVRLFRVEREMSTVTQLTRDVELLQAQMGLKDAEVMEMKREIRDALKKLPASIIAKGVAA